MLHRLNTFLNRPIAEDFSFKNQIWQSLQGGLYVFLFLYFFGNLSSANKSASIMSGALLLAVFGAGCVVSTLVANWVVPTLLPTLYDEDRWTVWKFTLQTLFVLFCVSAGNQLLLILLRLQHPTFGQMYLTVTIIGFFPIIMSVVVTEQRRLKRNLAHAQVLNEQLRHQSAVTLAAPVALDRSIAINPLEMVAPEPIVLLSENGKERLSLQPDQLRYVESVGNYVEVHWANATQLQKTVMRSTLKDVADSLAAYPQFFRCHRAFLVNLRAISQTEGNARGYQLTLSGSHEKIPVSRSYLDAFDERMNTRR